MQKYKYPRTYHLPYSKGYTSDDKVLDNDNIFHDMKVVITEKMDGENTTIYRKQSEKAASLQTVHSSQLS